jgi:transcriptional regulator with XRE-family HTH domain
VPRTAAHKTPIARRLREARLRAGLSQRKLGALIGFDLSVAGVRINQYERDVHEPHYTTIQQIASALGLPTPYFYADDSVMAELILAAGRMSITQRKQLLASTQETNSSS